MKLNAMFPTRYIGTDPAAIKDWAKAAQALGVDMVMLYPMFPMPSLAAQINVLERFKAAVSP